MSISMYFSDLGYFANQSISEKLWFVDFARPDYFVPFNYFRQPYLPNDCWHYG